MQETIIATIGQGCADTKLEVVLLQDETTGTRIELRNLTWGTGLGWYRQQTFVLEHQAARDLARSLRHMHNGLTTDRAAVWEDNVIPFPALSGTPQPSALDLIVQRTVNNYAM